MSSGGKGNSRANTNSDTRTTTSSSTINTVDNRAIEGNGAVVGGNVTVNSGDASQVNLQTTDLGAIAGGLDLALESLHGIQQATAGSTAALQSVTHDSIQQAYDLANEARQSESSGAFNNFVKIAAVVAVVAIIAYVAVKSKK